MLLGPAWRVGIVFTHFFRESSVFVCWPGVCMLIIYVGGDAHLSFLAYVGSAGPFRF